MALKKVKRPTIERDVPIEKQILNEEKTNINSEDKVVRISPNVKEKSTEYYKNESSITIESINRNIDTDKYTSTLIFYFKGEKHSQEVNRSGYLSKREIIKLQDYGLQVTESGAKNTICDLVLAEMDAPLKLVHSTIGFDTYNDKYIFKHFDGIGVQSSYNGDLDIAPKGNYNIWLETIMKHVVGNTALEAMLVIGFSSAIVGLLSKGYSYDSIFAHLSGDSTTGKTTASMLAISIWGNPSTKVANGLASSWNATENAMFTNIVGNHGLAALYDEVSANDSLDFTKFIYKFTGNKDKVRLNKESKLKDTGTWGTTIISNGEFSLLEKSKRNTGAQLRIMDFHNTIWTKNAESADIILQTILNNYGYAGINFVTELMKEDPDAFYNEVQKTRELVIERMEEEGIKDKYIARRAWKYAAIMFTAQKVKDILSIPLNIEEIWDFFIENEKQSIDNRDLQKSAFSFFLEQVNIHYKKFVNAESLEAIDEESIKNNNEFMGKINILKNETYNEICIFPSLFKELMKKGGFEDSNIILKRWKEEGILDCESDRYTRKRVLIKNGGTVSVYVIKVNKDVF